MVVVFTGGRDYRDHECVDRVLRWWHNRAYEQEERLIVVVGDAPGGLDSLVRKWCTEKGVNFLLGVANWGKQGKKAGPWRNQAMLMAKPDAVVAFPGGNGTKHCKTLAQSLGLPIYEVKSMREWEERHP